MDESDKPKEQKGEYKRKTPGQYSKKVDFVRMEKMLDGFLESFMSEAKPIQDIIFESLYDQLKAKRIVQEQNPDKMESVHLKYLKNLNLLFKSKFREAFRQAKTEAANEIVKVDMAVSTLPLPSEDFIEFLDSEIKAYIGDWAYKLTQKARLEIAAAIKDGRPISTVIGILDDEGKELSRVGLERFARTKFTEVMNRGRISFYEDSGIVAGYQFSAILDDSTSEICDGLHGRIFKAGEQPVPPLHFNALVEGSQILTKNGLIPIENIRVGDEVLTHKGRYCKVYDTMSKFEDKEYFTIDTDNGLSLKITGEHPVLTTRGWVRADELRMLDDIVCLEK